VRAAVQRRGGALRPRGVGHRASLWWRRRVWQGEVVAMCLFQAADDWCGSAEACSGCCAMVAWPLVVFSNVSRRRHGGVAGFG